MTTNNDLSKVWPEWQIEEQLGKGSYGVVYKAVRRDHNVESWAAIKVISIPSDPSEVDSLRSEGMDMDDTRTYLQGIVDDFVSEIQLMESLKGIQNIVSVEDYKVVEKTDELGWDIYIRMELLTPFNTYICDKKLTEADVIKLGCDICTALERCNERNVIHRDIKPENIFINDFGDFKLGDFGIARKMENLTGGLSQKGTYNYMAPEVKNSVNYDARVDTYSLGIVLYRLLNDNLLPFLEKKQLRSPNERVLAVERRMQGEALFAPCDASSAMANLILRACAYDPDMRFDSATEMKEALMSVSAGTYQKVCIDLDKTKSVRRAPVVTEQKDRQNINTFVEIVPKKRSWSKIIVSFLILLVGISVAVFAFIGHGEKQENIAAIIDDADILANAENYEGALAKLEDGLAEYPKSEDLQKKIDGYTAALTNQKISAIVVKSDQLANGGSHDEAIEMIEAGLVTYPESTVLQGKLTEYTTALAVQVKSQTLTDAKALAEVGEFEAAMSLIQVAQETYGPDNDYQSAYETYHQEHINQVKNEATATANSLATSGDYLGAIQTINQASSIIGEDVELASLSQSYEDAYTTEIVMQADTYLNQRMYTEANAVVNDGLQLFPDNEKLKAKLDILKTLNPISLTTLNELNSSYWYWNEDSPEDPFGNSYSDACNYVVFDNNNKEGYVEYRVYQKYGTITGIIAPHADIGERYTGFVQIYADDILVYTSPTVSQKVDAFDFAVDISGAEYIKIVIKISDITFSQAYGKILLADVQLFPIIK